MPETDPLLYAHEEAPSDREAEAIGREYAQAEAEVQALLVAAAAAVGGLTPAAIAATRTRAVEIVAATRARVLPRLARQIELAYYRGHFAVQRVILEERLRRGRRPLPTRLPVPAPVTPAEFERAPLRPRSVPVTFDEPLPDGAVHGLAAAQKVKEVTPEVFQLPGFTAPSPENRQQVMILLDNATTTLANAEELVGRRVDDVLRAASLEAVTESLQAGENLRDRKQRVVDALDSAGVTHTGTHKKLGQVRLINVGGRNLQLGKYAEMVARTTPREAATIAGRAAQQSKGLWLVRVSTHPSSCDICNKYDGKIFSTGPTDLGYPVADAMTPYHPNCRHSEGPFVP